MSDTKKSPLNVTNEMNRMGLNKNNAVSNKDWESSMQQMQGTSGDVGYKPSSIPEDYANNVTADYTDEDYKRMEKEKRQQEKNNKVTFTEQKGKEAQEVSKGLRDFINGILNPQKEQSLSASRIKEKRNKKTRADYDNFIREMIDNKDTFIEKFGYDKTTPPEIVFKMMMKQAGDNNTKAIEEIAEDIKKKNVVHDTQMAAKGKADSGDGNSQGAVNNQQASATPTPSTPPPAPTTSQKKSDTEDLTKGGLGDSIPEVGSFYTPDVREELKAIDKSMEKEQQTGHRFYSRIFSVPEWFPKGLDEFREAKKKYTNRPVYNKVTGKYEMGEGASPIAAKKELNIAKQVVDGLTKDVKNTEKSLEENTKRLDELSESKRQTSGNWEDLPDDIKETYRDKANKFISDNRQRLNQEATQLINSAYSKGGDKGKELVKKYKEKYGYEPEDTSINITSPKELADLYKIIYNLPDSERDEFEKLYSDIQDSLKKQWNLLTDSGDNDNLAKEYFEKDRAELEKSGLTDDTYDPTQNKTVFDVQQETVDRLGETLDAIKNGDLKDANEKVEKLKSAYEQSKEQQKIDMQEYSAAKRKLIKENAGDIARNVWFIIDLVTTMNRNAARLMPQGKYSPNLGNFETPALFQDYAEQLKNIRDSYNEANKEAAVGKVKLGLERGSEANKAIGEYYKNLADKDKDIFDISVQTEKDRRQALIRIMENKEISRLDNELKKDYIKFYMDTHKNTQASLQEMLNDIDSVNTFINRPRVLAGLDKQQQQNWLYYNQATSPDTKDAIFKELVTDIYRKGIDEKKSDEEIKNDVRNFLIDLIRNEVATTNDTVKLRKYQNKLNYINSTTDTFGKAWENIVDKPATTGQNIAKTTTEAIKNILK